MPVFHYKVLDVAGQVSEGTLAADAAEEGRRNLRERGWRIERFGPVADGSKSEAWSTHGVLETLRGMLGRIWDRPSRRADRVADFARQLALLLRSGVPLTEGLDVLIGQEHHRGFETILRDVLDRVRSGVSLADALTPYPMWFDATFLAAVQVGQRSGGLDKALTQLATFLKERSGLRHQVTAALTYPCILLVLGVCVTLFLMTRVIPQLLTVLMSSGKPLPTATAILKTCTDVLVGYWPWLLLGVVGIAALGTAVIRSRRGRRVCEGTILRTPIAGSLIQKTLVARFAQQMTMLLGSGVPFIEAIRIVRNAEHHTLLVEELGGIERAIEAGSDIAPTLANSRVFPPLVVHLVAVGQSAGELPQMLDELRIGYETEVKIALTKFTAALEPLLIVVMAALIGFVIFATVMPILQVTEVMR
ncbi:MAG: type II secretion system F family protein [Planctomycetes bacterium]|nr:type II secretion system F family protein [Planctomycetota bacterium]